MTRTTRRLAVCDGAGQGNVQRWVSARSKEEDEEEIVERRSDKHSPRADEELQKETQSLEQGSPIEVRAEESREQEGPGEGEPIPGPVVERQSETPG